MKFPYGICDFYKIITGKYYYCDRTYLIPKIEAAGEHLLFLRPRRFGKSLLLSMLENYYDVGKADEFESLFAHLVIGKNPTEKHNQYFILKWDFSSVSPQGDVRRIEKNLYDYINIRIEDFSVTYQKLLPREITITADAPALSFQSLLTAIKQTPYKLFLLVDEYDNFANEVLMGKGDTDSSEHYRKLVYGEGCLKALFKVVKAATAGEGLDRAFITGVSPVVMSDITSGHNIAENISMEPEFSDICGFREAEIADTIGGLVRECRMPPEKQAEAMGMMRTFYNGYCFSYDNSGEKKPVYNPTLALYFMKHFQKRCAYPRRILDSNLAMDKNKITYISRLPGGKQIIMDALGEESSPAVPELADRFGVEDMLSPQKDTVFMVSLLYYFGVLTLTEKRTVMGKAVFRIPNLVIRKLYAERMQEMLLPDFSEKDDAVHRAELFYRSGSLQPLCDFMEQHYFKAFDNRDYRWANELTVKTAFLTLLFNDTFYIMDSEPALDRKYADMTMIVRPDMRQYELLDFLLEFKFTDMGRLPAEQVRKMSREELKALPSVKEKLKEAGKNLRDYRKSLEQIHGSTLRLKVFAIVAVGFERLVWEEV